MTPDERQARILDEVRAIPVGFVRTYGDVSPQAPRLAGRLLGSVHARDLPWWRVVRADGSLAAGAQQRDRLEAEGVPFRRSATPRVDLKLARLASRRSELLAPASAARVKTKTSRAQAKLGDGVQTARAPKSEKARRRAELTEL
jgi:methylated-DNA-protein-cysteine methyltransferase-like protein